MKLKRILASFISFAMIFSTMSFNVFAEESTTTTISTLAELEAFRTKVNNGEALADTVTLSADIDLSSVSDWIPIGNGTRNGSSYTGNAFKGTFDGAGHTISGLTITSDNTADCAGLFGVLDGATVKNTKFTGVSIKSANKNAGAVAGLAVNNSTISGIEVSGSVTAVDGVGGVLGRMTISGTVSNCVNNANVTGAAAGGIIGKAYYTGSGSEMNISNCTNNGTMTNNAAGCAGGIVGFSAANITGCINNGNITSSNEDTVGIALGGISGWQVMYGEISNNTNTGAVEADGYITTAGGIVGWVNYQYKTDGTSTEYPACEIVSVNGNTNTASIIAPKSSLGSGGIVGGVYNAVYVKNNINRANKITGEVFAAGIVGNYQNNDDNGYSGTDRVLDVTGNTTYTKIENITANCTNVVCYDNVFYLETDYTLTNTVITSEPVAKIGDVEYADLQTAINAAQDGAQIDIIADFELTSQEFEYLNYSSRLGYAGVIIPDDKKLVIDLAGHTITYSDAYGDYDNAMIINIGDLTINDSVGEGELAYSSNDNDQATKTYTYLHPTILNGGKLTLNNGVTVKNTAPADTDCTNAIENHSHFSYQYANDAVCIVNDANLITNKYFAVRQYTHYYTGYANDVIINDGYVTGIYMQQGDLWWNQSQDTNRYAKGSLTINGGRIEALRVSDDYTCYAIRMYLSSPENPNWCIAINDGIIDDLSIRVQRGTYYANGTSGERIDAEANGARNVEWLEANGGFITGGTFTNIGSETDVTSNVLSFLADGYTLTENEDGTYSVTEITVAKIGDVKYATLQEAINNVESNQTIELLAGEISEGTVKFPATLTNVTIKGADGKATVLKDMVLQSADGNSTVYEGITIDGIVFENSRIVMTGWRTETSYKDWIITNCEFKNIDDTTNIAAVHLNLDETEAVENFTFTNNVIDGATGGSKSGVYMAATGNVTFTDNVINNVAFRPILLQVNDVDGIVDNITITGNTFSGSEKGRLQVYGTEETVDGVYVETGTDTINMIVSENIFKDISSTYYICCWGINPTYSTVDLSKNYYDIAVEDNLNKFYWNNVIPTTVDELAEMGVTSVYTELNEDGTIDTDSLVSLVPATTTTPFKDAPLFLAGLADEVVDGVTYHPVYMATSIDSLNYKKVGFNYIFSIFDSDGNVTFTAPYTTETSDVYTSISDANTTYTVDSIGGNGAYLFMNKLWFNADYYNNDNTKITITPYAIDMNGNTITGWTFDMTNEYYKSLQTGDNKVNMFAESEAE